MSEIRPFCVAVLIAISSTFSQAATEPAAPLESYRVLSTDTTLIPVIVRWAQTDDLMAVLNGRKVTTRTLREEAYLDLPLTPEARVVAGATAQQAIRALLTTYAGYSSDLEVSATMKTQHLLAIETRRLPSSPGSQAQASPESQPAYGMSAVPQPTAQGTINPALPTTAPSASPIPSPQAATSTTAAFLAERDWDTPAQKAAGVIRGQWLIGTHQTLRSVVESWGAAAGLRVVWQSAHDYPITNAMRSGVYPGTFREALYRLAAAYGELPVPLAMTFSSPSGGTQTLRIFDVTS